MFDSHVEVESPDVYAEESQPQDSVPIDRAALFYKQLLNIWIELIACPIASGNSLAIYAWK